MNLTLEEMKAEYEAAKEDYTRCSTRTAKLGISDVLYNLKKKIDAEQNRVDSQLKEIIIDGQRYLMPKSFSWYNPKEDTLKLDGNILYVLDMRNTIEKDGSYHWHHYAWIPQTENKYAKLCVRTLGKDTYGDRYFLSVTYYKHPADPYHYLEKYLAYNNRTYKPYLDFILKELGLTEVMANYKPR